MSGLTLSPMIDIQALLKPISASSPAGESVRYDGTYDRIQEARREDDQRLSQGIYKTNLKRADWDADEIICIEALVKRSKDLQVGGWLLEAWLHLYGFPGVKEGLKLLTGLCKTFWGDLHPHLEGNSFEDRTAPIDWINQKLSLRLKQIPLTLPIETDGRSYSYADWESSCHFENLARRDPGALQEALANIDPTVATFQNAVTLTDISFHASVVEGLGGAVKACGELQELLDEKCGGDGPSLYQFHEVLTEIKQFMSHSLQAREEATPAIEQEYNAIADNGSAEIEIWSSGPIRSRADAYNRLAEAADYLMKTEPHSPTPYLVRRAVEWGHMNLADVLKQIVRNEGEMGEIDRLLRLSGKDITEVS